MKRKSYLPTLIIIIALLLSVFTVCASASIDAEAQSTSDTEQRPEALESDDGENLSAGSDATYESVFAQAYEKLRSYSTEIFSVLSLIGTVVIVFLYKSGLFPMMKSGISALSSTVKAIKDEACSRGENLDEFKVVLGEKLDMANTILEKATLSLDAVTEKLKSAELAQKNSESVRHVLLSEIDMLYDIFMAASLPQYEKDRIGERVAAMKATLAPEAASDEA